MMQQNRFQTVLPLQPGVYLARKGLCADAFALGIEPDGEVFALSSDGSWILLGNEDPYGYALNPPEQHPASPQRRNADSLEAIAGALEALGEGDDG